MRNSLQHQEIIPLDHDESLARAMYANSANYKRLLIIKKTNNNFFLSLPTTDRRQHINNLNKQDKQFVHRILNIAYHI